jgi:release factor glutamine methyltransferase
MNANSSTTISNWLKRSSDTLLEAGVATARLDCLVLLEDVSGKDRTHLLAHDEQILSIEQIDELNGLINRRALHEPLAYIRNKTEFYGREFAVTADTLEPRPETETMISLVKAHSDEVQTLVDVGTGSGAIAITAKLELPDLTVIATEINAAALAVAQQNAQKLAADVTFLPGDLLAPAVKLVREQFAVAANLPYVPDSYTINEAAMQEPKAAIFGGVDGLDLYRRMFDQIEAMQFKPSLILTESMPFQHHGLATIARRHGYALEETDDFIQVFKS